MKIASYRFVPVVSACLAIACMIAPVLAQVVDPQPYDCPRGVDCYAHPCHHPCSGNKRCASGALACCCHPIGNPAPHVASCTCKPVDQCNNSSTPGQQCRT